MSTQPEITWSPRETSDEKVRGQSDLKEQITETETMEDKDNILTNY